jgi:hypothetical protein
MAMAVVDEDSDRDCEHGHRGEGGDPPGCAGRH